MDLPESVVDLLTGLRDYLQDKCEPPVYVSDRRFMKAINLLQVAAFADGRNEVSPPPPPLLPPLLIPHSMQLTPCKAWRNVTVVLRSAITVSKKSVVITVTFTFVYHPPSPLLPVDVGDREGARGVQMQQKLPQIFPEQNQDLCKTLTSMDPSAGVRV